MNVKNERWSIAKISVGVSKDHEGNFIVECERLIRISCKPFVLLPQSSCELSVIEFFVRKPRNNSQRERATKA